ncbi:MAG TPA: hypothetical protein VMB84_07705 [Stellaceae bacterium]|nr:hypothetical protein [Stellaceae bacterium]
MRLTIAAAVAVAGLFGVGAALADGLTPSDYQYLQRMFGLTAQSGPIADLTPNESQALHSAIDDLKTYPEGRDRQVRRYLTLVYPRECKRWVEAHPGDAPCSPPADPAAAPGKAASDRLCAECHLFGSSTAPAFREMAQQREWNAHKVGHALRHNHDLLLRLSEPQLDALAVYINSLKP